MAQRRPIGIYFQTDGTIVFYGRRRAGKDIPGTRWMTVTAPAQRELLDAQDLRDLKVSGGRVRMKSAAELAADRNLELAEGDDARFDNERELAILGLILDEINVLRTAASLPPRTVAQARTAYRNKLGR